MKVDRTPLNVTQANMKALEMFIEQVKEAVPDDEQMEQKLALVHILEWTLDIVKQHYKNLLHCYAINERGPKKKVAK